MLFLSFCGEEREAARALARGLKDAGTPVWCSAIEGQIKSGGRWVQAIYDALAQCSGYAVLVGSGPLDGWVTPELDFALNVRAQRTDFAVIPILMPGREYSDLPSYLQGFEPLRLHRDFERSGPDYFSELAKQIGLHALPELIGSDYEDGPFPGLEFFDVDRARFFFGRGDEVREMCERVGRTPAGYRRWLHVHGGSGSGKSSLVRAGLIPAIQRGWLEDAPTHWRIAMMRPGRDPDRRLAEAIAKALGLSGADLDREIDRLLASDAALANATRERMPKGFGLLLVVDQLEEVFTHGGAFQRFDGWLDTALREDGPLHLITTMRSDFLHRFEQRLPTLFDGINERASNYQVGRVRTAKLPLLIEGPARLAGLELQPGLVDRLLRELEQTQQEAQEEPTNAARDPQSSLPLLAHALRTLWQRREGRTLVHGGFKGPDGKDAGIRGLIAESADRLMASLSADERKRAWNLIFALVRTGRGEPDTRKTITYEDALERLGGGEGAESLLARLSGGRDPQAGGNAPPQVRLITAGGGGVRPRVDLVHDVLLRSWKALRDHVDEQRRDLERRDDLDAVAQVWERNERHPGGLPEGGQLAWFESIAHPTPLGAECLRAARAKARRRKLIVRAVGLTLVVLTIAAGSFAEQARRERNRRQPYLDRLELGDLSSAEQILWPKGDLAALADFDEWLARARAVVDRKQTHQSALEGSRSAAASARPSANGASPRIKGEIQTLEELLTTIDAFGNPEQGLVRTLELRREAARRWAEAIHDPRWTEARGRVRENPRYTRLELVPQRGLIPLGFNPVTNLEEFCIAGSGREPVRRPSGQLQIAGDTALVMVLVPQGSFTMGPLESKEGTPARAKPTSLAVVFEQPFFLASTEMSNGVLRRLLGTPRGHGDDNAVVNDADWETARAGLRGLDLRLPSEAEWEYACRAGGADGSATEDEHLGRVGWYAENAKGRLHAVAELEPNSWGLYDMRGNVREWCEDAWRDNYQVTPPGGAALTELAKYRVIRGGHAFGEAKVARSRYREKDDPASKWGNLGYRVALSVKR